MASAEAGRRSFLKYAVTAVVCGVVAGVGGFFAGSAAVPPPVTSTVTETVTKTAPGVPGATVTTTITTTETATKTVTKVIKPTPEAPKGEPIRIGCQEDLTGFCSAFGWSKALAFEAAIKKINEELGGIDGRPVEGYIEDTQTKSDVGAEKFRKLVLEHRCDFITSSTSSGVNIASMPLAKELKTPYFNGASMSHQLCGGHGPDHPSFPNKGNRWFVSLQSLVSDQVPCIAPVLYEHVAHKWATVYWDYAWGQSHDVMFSEAIEALGGKIVAHIPVPLGTKDFLPYIAKIPKEAEAVYPVFLLSASVGFLTQLKESGYEGELGFVICLVDGVDCEAIADIVKGCWTLEYWPRMLKYDDTPYNRAYRKAVGKDEYGYQTYSGKRIMATGSHSWAVWQNVFLMKEAVEATGWKSRKDNQKIIEYVEKVGALPWSYEYPQGPMVVRAEDHHGVGRKWLSRVDEKGRIHVVEELPIEESWSKPTIDFRKMSF